MILPHQIILTADNSGINNHVTFSLNKEGGFIGLFTSSGTVIDSFSYGYQLRDISFGRSDPDHDKLVYFSETTKGVKNSTITFTSISETPQFSIRGGFYSGKQTIILTSSTPDAIIHYTTNGKEPDATCAIYSEPIVLSKTTALRARAIESNELPSLTVTQTYLIDEIINLPVVSIVTDSANFFDDSIGIYITGTNGIRGSCDAKIRNLNQD
ncbi:MAG: chitobiase/beta-hexosaminidase C-terminal domain-containing protein, partial [Bacteroidia bacterium]|nr:chitobiase/beta-hexosaminidase C-terminal domain-containing protein [Bacteroidia bacterium]